MNSKKSYWKVLYNYEATNNFQYNGYSDISVKKDELLIDLENTYNGWAFVELENNSSIKGYIPLNYLKKEIISDSKKELNNNISTIIEKNNSKQFIALNNYSTFYQNKKFNQKVPFTMKKGDILDEIDDNSENGFIKVKNKQNIIGLVPENYLQPFISETKINNFKPSEEKISSKQLQLSKIIEPSHVSFIKEKSSLNNQNNSNFLATPPSPVISHSRSFINKPPIPPRPKNNTVVKFSTLDDNRNKKLLASSRPISKTLSNLSLNINSLSSNKYNNVGGDFSNKVINSNDLNNKFQNDMKKDSRRLQNDINSINQENVLFSDYIDRVTSNSFKSEEKTKQLSFSAIQPTLLISSNTEKPKLLHSSIIKSSSKINIKENIQSNEILPSDQKKNEDIKNISFEEKMKDKDNNDIHKKNINNLSERLVEGDEQHVEGVIFVTHKRKIILKAATLEKLIERLYCENTITNDFITEYVDTFLLTYRSFTTPKEVLSKLTEAYNQCLIENPIEEENNKLKAKKLRICNFLKRWIENHFDDFKDDNELFNYYNQFIENISFKNGELIVPLLKKAISKGKTRSATEYKYQSNLYLLKEPNMQLNLFDFDPNEIAKQLALIEFDLFQKILPKELLTTKWTKSYLAESSPHILRMIERFNNFSCWVSYYIVKEENLKKRVNIICKFLKIAKKSLSYNNFFNIFEIISGLQRTSVFRLKKTWELVKKEREYSFFEELLRITSPANNFSQYREKLRTSNPPCVPYLGVYQQDLTFIQDGNKDILENGYINFFKRILVSEIIKEIQTYQQISYNFSPVENILKWLNSQEIMEHLDENTIYNVSLIIEPREDSPSIKKHPKKKKDSLFKLYSTNINAEQQLSKIESTTKLNKLNKFFGEQSIDFDFYQKYSKNMETPKSILDDINAPKISEHESIKTPEKMGESSFDSNDILLEKEFIFQEDDGWI